MNRYTEAGKQFYFQFSVPGTTCAPPVLQKPAHLIPIIFVFDLFVSQLALFFVLLFNNKNESQRQWGETGSGVSAKTHKLIHYGRYCSSQFILS